MLSLFLLPNIRYYYCLLLENIFLFIVSFLLAKAIKLFGPFGLDCEKCAPQKYFI
jgi:hypothetical protein